MEQCMEQNIRNLGSALLLRATKDFVHGSPNRQRAIIKELKSDWCNYITLGRSLVVAEQLEKHPQEIAARLKMYDKRMENGGNLKC